MLTDMTGILNSAHVEWKWEMKAEMTSLGPAEEEMGVEIQDFLQS